MAPDHGFEVELHVGGRVIAFEMTVDFLRSSNHPGIRSLMEQDSRDQHWRAAVATIDPIFDGGEDDEIQVIDREGALWIIKPAAVQMVRVYDPLDNKRQTAGFHMRVRPATATAASQPPPPGDGPVPGPLVRRPGPRRPPASR